MKKEQLYIKIASLPASLREEVAHFIDDLLQQNKEFTTIKRVPNKAKGKVAMKSNFDDPLPGLESYRK